MDDPIETDLELALRETAELAAFLEAQPSRGEEILRSIERALSEKEEAEFRGLIQRDLT